MRTHYDNLQVSETASAEVIRASYKALVQKWHPDRHSDQKEKAERYVKIINSAYETLSDASARRAYDRWLKTQRANGPERATRDENLSRQEALKSAWRDGYHSGLAGLTSDACIHQGDFAEVWREGLSVGQEELRAKKATSAHHHEAFAEAWKDGHSSFHQGFKLIQCPYTDERATAWKNGFKAAAQTGRPLRRSASPKGSVGQWCYFAILASIFIGVILLNDNDEKGSAAAQPPKSYQAPQLPLPATGYSATAIPAGVAPLTVRASAGTNYYVKLEDIQTRREVASFFIRAGETLNVNVPAGRYEMKYATGPNWYGPKYLFGPQTAYSKAEAVFDFSFDGYRYSGYTVELIQQAGGNLSTGQINPSQW